MRIAAAVSRVTMRTPEGVEIVDARVDAAVSDTSDRQMKMFVRSESLPTCNSGVAGQLVGAQERGALEASGARTC